MRKGVTSGLPMRNPVEGSERRMSATDKTYRKRHKRKVIRPGHLLWKKSYTGDTKELWYTYADYTRQKMIGKAFNLYKGRASEWVDRTTVTYIRGF